MIRILAAIVSLVLLQTAAPPDLAAPPRELPASAAAALESSLAASRRHTRHLWRDTKPVNADGTVNAYVEISRNDRRKWEFDMGANRRAIDRVMPEALGGYPVNYGFVPQTVSYDGDPFDALVLGPPLPGGRMTRGLIVGLMLMEDEKGVDSKVILSPVDAAGRPTEKLSESDQSRMAAYFREYKKHEPGKFSRVPGWGSAAQGRAFVQTTHAFFVERRTMIGR
jgi:inorganic pyrophosphatase